MRLDDRIGSQWIDLHTHTNYSDGKCSPEEMIRAAIGRGIGVLGITDHCYAPYDLECGVPKEKLADRCREIRALADAYRGRIRVLCGIEQDFYSPAPTDLYDYVIGSVHFLYRDGVYLDVDASVEHQKKYVTDYFDGDWYAFAEAYFDLAARVPEQTHADLIGHFDLVSKFNENNVLFDVSHPRYVAAWQKAAGKLLESGLPFEINVGAISRGYRTAPYPDRPIFDWLKARGVTFLLSSDSHAPETLAFRFDEWYEAYGLTDALTGLPGRVLKALRS